MREQSDMARSERKGLLNHHACKTCQTGKMCKDIERELSRLTGGLFGGVESLRPGIENIASKVEPEDKDDQALLLAAKLKLYALPNIYVDVIVLVCVNNWSFAEVAQQLDIVSRQQARWIYNRGLELLKERGFS